MPQQRAEKPLHWVGSAKKDLLALPPAVVDDFGYALSAVQMGATPPQAKPWLCFQKKSPSGVHAAQPDVALIHERLKLAQKHYKEHHES